MTKQTTKRRRKSSDEKLERYAPRSPKEEERFWADVEARERDNRARLRANLFTLINQVFGPWTSPLIEALRRFQENRIEPRHWAVEYERMEAERARLGALYEKWAQEAEETIDAYAEERHEEFERLVATKGKEAEQRLSAILSAE